MEARQIVADGQIERVLSRLGRKCIVLVGMMGAGKTSIGRALAARLACDFADTDAQVEQDAGCTIARIFTRDGEAAFRELEHRALARLLRRPKLVLATGGGAPLDPRNRALLHEQAFTIWLNAEPATLARRLGEAGDRPLLGSGDRQARLTELLEERRPFYAGADLRIVTDGRSPAQVVDAIASAMGR